MSVNEQEVKAKIEELKKQDGAACIERDKLNQIICDNRRAVRRLERELIAAEGNRKSSYCIDISDMSFEEYQRVYNMLRSHVPDEGTHESEDRDDFTSYTYLGVDDDFEIVHWDDVSDFSEDINFTPVRLIKSYIELVEFLEGDSK